MRTSFPPNISLGMHVPASTSLNKRNASNGCSCSLFEPSSLRIAPVRFGQRERSSSYAARLLAPVPGDAVAPRPGSAAGVARALRLLQAQRHAVAGAAAPSPTVVAFLLHVLLPSPRAGDTAAK